MKKPILLLSLTLLHLLTYLESSQGARRTDNHLVPFLSPSASDELLRTVYEKLCITPADCGRMIEFPGERNKGEFAVSIHCDKSLAVERCHVTLTKAVANMGYIWGDNLGKRPFDLLGKVRVIRRDAPIPKTTASAVRTLWAKMLGNVRPRRPDALIVLGGDRIEFWIEDRSGKAVKAEIPDSPGESVIAFVDLGRVLAKYCEAPPSLRVSIARDIERDARRLAATGP